MANEKPGGLGEASQTIPRLGQGLTSTDVYGSMTMVPTYFDTFVRAVENTPVHERQGILGEEYLLFPPDPLERQPMPFNRSSARFSAWSGHDSLVECSMYLNRNQVLVASRADGLRKLCHDPDLSLATEIEISNVRLADIPDEVFSAKQLKSLTITESSLKSVSPRIKELSELRELILSQNSLESFPMEIGLLSHLDVLDVSSNRFRLFPVEVSSLASLSRLDVSENEIGITSG